MSFLHHPLLQRRRKPGPRGGTPARCRAGRGLPDRQRLLHRRQRRAVQSPRLQLHFSARKPWHRRRRTERLLIRPGARL